MKTYLELECNGEDIQHISLQSALSFFTGVDEVPPEGFPHDPVLNFAEDCKQEMPTASTCAIQLTLPTCHSDYSSFQRSLNVAFVYHGGFGLH